MFEYERVKQELQYQLSPNDFIHKSSLFLGSNDKAICKIHGRKLPKLISNMHERGFIDEASNNPNKVINNVSNYHLTDCDKFLLTKGINFSHSTKEILNI